MILVPFHKNFMILGHRSFTSGTNFSIRQQQVLTRKQIGSSLLTQHYTEGIGLNLHFQ